MKLQKLRDYPINWKAIYRLSLILLHTLSLPPAMLAIMKYNRSGAPPEMWYVLAMSLAMGFNMTMVCFHTILLNKEL